MSIHHREPISLGGLDDQINKREIAENDHKLIHLTCDINSRLYHTLLRKHRQSTAGHIVMTEKGLNILHEMQQIYFEGQKRLPQYLQDIGDGVIVDTVDYWGSLYKKMTGDEYDIDYENFSEGLLVKQKIQLAIQKDIISTLRKQYILS